MPTLAATTPMNRQRAGIRHDGDEQQYRRGKHKHRSHPVAVDATATQCSKSVACAASMATLHVTNMIAIVPLVRPSVWRPKRLKPTSNVPVANDANPPSSIDARTKRGAQLARWSSADCPALNQSGSSRPRCSIAAIARVLYIGSRLTGEPIIDRVFSCAFDSFLTAVAMLAFS